MYKIRQLAAELEDPFSKISAKKSIETLTHLHTMIETKLVDLGFEFELPVYLADGRFLDSSAKGNPDPWVSSSGSCW